MEPAKKESGGVIFKAGSYSVTANFVRNNIKFRAYSELAGKLFEGSIEDKDLSSANKQYFGDCSGVFEMLEECVADKRDIELSDTGELKISYSMKLGRKNEVTRYLDFNLKEVEIGDIQKLSIKVDRLEAENKELRKMFEELKTEKCIKIVPEIDLTTSNNVTNLGVNGLEITTNKGGGAWYAAFLKNKLEGRQFFEVEIVAVNSNGIMIGVAGESLRNVASCYSNVEAVAWYPNGSMVYFEGKSRSLTQNIVSGDRIMVKVDRVQNSIEWLFTYPLKFTIAKISIPSSMREKVLYPVVNMIGSYNDKIRFM